MAEQGQGAIWVTQLCAAVLRYTLNKKKIPGCIIEHVYPIFTLIRIQFQASKRHDEKSTSRSHFRICVWPRWEAAFRTTDPRGLRRQDGQDGRRNDGAEGSRLVSTMILTFCT